MKNSKRLMKFNEVNVNDRLFIDLSGYKVYRTVVDILLAKVDKLMISSACKDYKNGEIEFEDIRRMIISTVKSFPGILPRVVIIEKLPDEDINELIRRFSALYLDD